VWIRIRIRIRIRNTDFQHRLNMELDLESLFGLHVPPPRIWAHIRGHYWSAKIDDISL
jgi:hypothetical protein